MKTALKQRTDRLLYRVWNERIKKDTDYPEWLDFEKFVEWSLANGYIPERAQLRKKDKSKPLGPDNCLWIEILYLKALGEEKTAYAWTKDPRSRCRTVARLKKRLKSGWPPEKAILTPPMMTPRKGTKPWNLPIRDAYRLWKKVSRDFEGWIDKDDFAEWVKQQTNFKLKGKTLTRRNTWHPYSPWNCYFAERGSKVEIAAPGRFKAFGSEKTYTEWASDPKVLCCSPKILRKRLEDGWNEERALMTSVFFEKYDPELLLYSPTGKSLKAMEWAKEPGCFVLPDLLVERLSTGWSLEEALYDLYPGVRPLFPEQKFTTEGRITITMFGPTEKGRTKVPPWMDCLCEKISELEGPFLVFFPNMPMKGVNPIEAISWQEQVLRVSDMIVLWKEPDTDNLDYIRDFYRFLHHPLAIAGCSEPKLPEKLLFDRLPERPKESLDEIVEEIQSRILCSPEGRKDKDSQIPLEIWASDPFQTWYHYFKKNNLVLTMDVLSFKRNEKNKTDPLWVIEVMSRPGKTRAVIHRRWIIGHPNRTETLLRKKKQDVGKVLYIEKILEK